MYGIEMFWKIAEFNRQLIDAEKMDQSIDVKGCKHNYIINTGNMDGFDCYRKLLNAQTHKAAFIHGNSFGTNVVIYHSIFY